MGSPFALAAGRLSPKRLLMLRQFLQFGAIGVAGFVWDTAIVYSLKGWLGLYAAGGISFIIVASINWLANRYWTYRELSHDAAHKQLARFLGVNTVGFVLNRGTYAALIATQPVVHDHPVLAIAAGAVAGMFFNFFLSRRLVFR